MVDALALHVDTKVLPIDRALLYDFGALRTWFYANRPDYVIHTAAAGNMYGKAQNIEILGANTAPLFHLLEVARVVPIKGLINFSSSSVLLPHQTVYSATKQAGEALCQAYIDEYDLPVMSVRPSTVIGPGEAAHRFIPTLIEHCKTGDPMPFTAKASHDYIDIQDLTNAIELVLKEKLFRHTINISSGKTYTNAEALYLVESLMGKAININPVRSLRSFDTPDWQVDNSALRSLGWKPQLSLSQSIQTIIDYGQRN